MLQLTFRDALPCPSFAALAEDAYRELKLRNDPCLHDACLSITLADLGESTRVRYRLLFACAGAAGCLIRVVTEAADMRAALRSGLAVLLGSFPRPVYVRETCESTRSSSSSACTGAECPM